VYFALIPSRDIELAKGANAADVAWFKVEEVLANPKLAFDPYAASAVRGDTLQADPRPLGAVSFRFACCQTLCALRVPVMNSFDLRTILPGAMWRHITRR